MQVKIVFNPAISLTMASKFNIALMIDYRNSGIMKTATYSYMVHL
jgi:hypothetical protein